MGKRLRTRSRKYFDDEILFVDDLGIHLKMGVRRRDFGGDLNYDAVDSNINYTLLDLEKKEVLVGLTKLLNNNF